MERGKEPALMYNGEELFAGPSLAELIHQRCREVGAGAPNYVDKALAESMKHQMMIDFPELRAAATYTIECLRRDDGGPFDQKLINGYEQVTAEHRRRELPPKWRILARRRFLHEENNPTVITLNI